MAKRKQASKTVRPAHAEQLDGPRDFPIVGIGASAGGLKAFETFFDHMPADSGMAFVLVQHLDPEHESKLAELLQHHSEMPVRPVGGDTVVEPDHVYVIPHDKGLTIEGGTLRLAEREPPGKPPVVIDRFFRSLAGDQGARAIGIVLSGTGNEGAQGLGAIKEAGGITLAQDEADAEYDGMPHSAVAAGFVDLVLPVSRMPAKLLEVKEHAADFKLPEDGEEDGESAQVDEAGAMAQIFAQVRGQTGHDFSNYKKSTVLRRLDRRMQVGGFDSLTDYLAYLRKEPAEVKALFREFLISVSNFFRDTQPMAALEHKAIPDLLTGKGANETVRVWVPACAGGQEAYSLAMLLAEACDRQEQPPRLQLFATDIDDDALQVAREGRYPGSIATDVSKERLERFFTEESGGYRVKDSLREMTLFTRHNLLKDPPFSNLDLVSCRNLLIYLDEDIQPRVFGLFHFALKPGGYLFLGSSESLGRATEKFAEVDGKARLFQRRQGATEITSFPITGLERTRPGSGPATGTGDQRRGIGELAQQLLLERYAPPCVIVDGGHAIRYVSGRVGKYLELAPGEPTQNVIELAREGLGLELRTALHQARASNEGSARRVRVRTNGGLQAVDLTVEPVPDSDGLLLVAFADAEKPGESEDAQAQGERAPPADAAGAVIEELERELKRTKRSLTAAIEELETANAELRASNEELQSMNEELQSTGEELETSKEELQSTNEELNTVNQELRNKVEEVSVANSVLGNLIASTDVATLFLDKELQLRRFTPRATELFHLIPGDIGRPLGHIAHRLDDQELLRDVAMVNESQVPLEREIRSKGGDWFLTRILPYRTVEGKIDGVVVTFIEITARKTAEQQANAARAYAEGIVNTLREPLLVLDADLYIRSASAAFYRDFQTTPEQTENRLLFELGDGQWNIPDLSELLLEVLPESTTVDDYEVRHDFPILGPRTMLLNARRIHQEGEQTERILLSLEDVTETRKAVAERRKHDLEVNLAESLLTERRRIGRDIHDGLVQNLVGVRMLSANLAKQLAHRDAPETMQMKEFADLIGEMNSQVRELMNGLAPVMIGGEALIPALERAAANIEEWYDVLCSVSYTQPVRLENDVTADHLYHIAREAMTNAAKHGKGSEIEVSLSVRGGALILEVQDDGTGFRDRDAAKGGTGVRNMRNRAELIGATLDIRQGPTGGTVVTCTLAGFEDLHATVDQRSEGMSHP